MTAAALATQPDPAFRFIDVAALRAILSDGGESALIDVREEGVQARDGHILWSVPLPLSRLEARAGTLLRRRGARIIVTDAGDGELARRAAEKLAGLGFGDIAVLDGGVAAWKAAGGEVYTGSGAYSKAFGEFVEHTYGTPHISARELKQRLDAGENVVVLDGRTVQEFENFSIPGAHAVPNAELPLRVHELVSSPDSLVVVNCAGRTRSIIGAQALINAGLPNRVVALENGTMAWLFEGYALVHGKRHPLPEPGQTSREKAREAVDALTSRFGIDWLDDTGLARLKTERETRALYLCDVRTQGEFEAGHYPGSNWAEGGQLIQGIDKYVGIRNARIVVIDDETAVRAAITASWLIQLGWGEVHAYAGARAHAAPVAGPDIPPLLVSPPDVPAISPADLAKLLKDGRTVVIDLDTSLAYEAGHVPGAWFAVRSRLPDGLSRLPAHDQIVVTSADGVAAAYAVPEIAQAADKPVRLLAGGTHAWRAANLPVGVGPASLLHKADDVWRSPYQLGGDRLAGFRAYLDWEVALLEQIGRDPAVRFATFPATGG